MYFTGDPLYPFGHGLSYTNFEYSDLEIDRETAGPGETVKVSFKVTNTGKTDGDEVAQLYVRDVVSSVKRPVRQLLGFRKVGIRAGGSATVSIDLPVDSLSFWDEDTGEFTIEPGEFEIQVGASSADIRLRSALNVE